MDLVFVCTVERFAGVVTEIERIDGILGQICPEAHLGDDGALEVVVAVHAHCVGVHGPSVRDSGKRRYFPLHELLGVLRCAFQRLLHDGIELVEVETLAGLDADPLHLRNDRLIGDVGRVHLEEFGRVGEVFGGWHGIDLNFRRRLHIDGRVDLHFHGLWRLAPIARAA